MLAIFNSLFGRRLTAAAGWNHEFVVVDSGGGTKNIDNSCFSLGMGQPGDGRSVAKKNTGRAVLLVDEFHKAMKKLF